MTRAVVAVDEVMPVTRASVEAARAARDRERAAVYATTGVWITHAGIIDMNKVADAAFASVGVPCR